MRKKGKEDAEVPISSLIDVVFLLIMFFVVTANIDKEAFLVPLELVQSKNIKPVETAPPKRVVININTDKNNKDVANFHLGDMYIQSTQLQAALTGVRNSMGNQTMVIIRADRNVLYQYTAELVEAVKASGLINVSIVAEKSSQE